VHKNVVTDLNNMETVRRHGLATSLGRRKCMQPALT
jgi:hypothetical protein